MDSHPLNSTAASLLGFLHDGPMSGWDLATRAQESIGNFWTVTQSQVYRELSKMAATGLVEAGEPGPRDRRPFALTDAGRAAFADWLSQEPPSETIRFPLLLTISFGAHLPGSKLTKFLARHRADHAARLAEYEEWLQEGLDDPYSLATLQFGVAYERAVLEWFDSLPSELTAE